MPAPRLLDKKTIAVSVASERKQDIEKGMKLTRSIEALQEAEGSERKRLEEFRESTLKAIQIEIDVKQRENHKLARENRSLKEERIRLEAPIDLTQAWKDVQDIREKNDSLSEHLLTREIDVTERENNVRDAQGALFARESSIRRSEEAIEENLRKAEEAREEAAEANSRAQETLTKITYESSEKRKSLDARDKEIDRREMHTLERERELEGQMITITNEKILLADRRATLERGFAELRRKQQN